MAVLVEVLSDNRNRTAAELRLAFSKNGGNLGESGCVGFLFCHRSEVTLTTNSTVGIDENALLEHLLELEADGYELTAEGALVHGPFTALETLQDGLRQRGWSVQDWGHQWHPLNCIDLQQTDQASQCLNLLEALEALDDVRSVSCNLGEIPELN